MPDDLGRLDDELWYEDMEVRQEQTPECTPLCGFYDGSDTCPDFCPKSQRLRES